ncbi:ATP-grasp domain-containing protein [Vibrio ouci]|uniref:ATP-grasp domain-containing protein n=1 Tax=Vibrio ouci TaxID=2499078 RepID=A0A4Y8WAJ9_9VIBR|nr:ATP-grasp domain-containing protein [Vibrio ouci]TFH89418.1 ATP-grasp domain-containing protein [Vibrio ouci]
MKICVVNPLSSGPCLIEALQDYGAEVIVALDEQFRCVYDGDTFTFVTTDQLISQVAALNCDLVISGSEFAVTHVDTVTSALRLQGHAPDRAQVRSNKVSMLKHLRSQGVDTAPFALVNSVDQLPDYPKEAFPLFVKPINSAGSDGCFRCDDLASVQHRVDALVNQENLLGNMNSQVMVQEYIEGQQYVVNTVSLGSQHVFGDILKVNLQEVDGIPIYREITATDIHYDKGLSKDIIEYVSHCLDALGVENGAAHTEVRVSRSGVSLIEVNYRLMGPDLFIDAFSYGIGYSHASLWAESIFEPQQFLNRVGVSKEKKMHFAMVYLRGHQAGTIRNRSNLNKIRRLPAFHSLRQLPDVGDFTENPKLTTGDFGIAYIAHESKAVFEQSLRRLKNLEDDGLYLIEEPLC